MMFWMLYIFGGLATLALWLVLSWRKGFRYEKYDWLSWVGVVVTWPVWVVYLMTDLD